MVDWVSGLPDASAAERLAGFVLLRLADGSAKECPAISFLQQDASLHVVNSAGASGSLSVAFRMGTTLREWDMRATASPYEWALNYVGADAPRSNVITAQRAGYVGINHATPSTYGRLTVGGNTAIVGEDATTKHGVLKGFRNSGTEMWRVGIKNQTLDNDALEIRSTNGNEIVFTISAVEQWRIGGGFLFPVADGGQSVGKPAQRVSTYYGVSGAINTSDARAKRDVGEIPADWLDAWTDVRWQRFKFIDGSRWHIGLIAQDVHAAFAAHGLDAFEIGLCCFDAWDEVREPVLDDEGNATGKTRQTQAPGDRWGLRYDECAAIEAAWQRRRIAQLEARIAAMEAGQ